jgi:hypothetical protein
MFLQASMRAEIRRPCTGTSCGPVIWIALSSALNSDPRDNFRRVSREIEALIQLEADRWIRLTDPVDVVQTRRVEDVTRVLEAVEKLTLVGNYHAAGFVTYEAGPRSA